MYSVFSLFSFRGYACSYQCFPARSLVLLYVGGGACVRWPASPSQLLIVPLATEEAC